MHPLDFFLAAYVIVCTLLEVPYTVAIHGENVVDATDREFSFVVALIVKIPNTLIPRQSLIFCTGTLISPRHVLTAAHCLTPVNFVLNPNQIEIIIGSVNIAQGDSYYAESWITHDQWRNNGKRTRLMHDVAIITLNETVNNPHVKVARLVPSARCTRLGARLKIAGWGKKDDDTHPINLQTANLRLMSPQECRQKALKLNYTYSTLVAQEICTWADSHVLLGCGDSGGPLVNEHNMVIGVNVGTCPKDQPEKEANLHLWNKHQFNLHMSLYYYRPFIERILGMQRQEI